MARIRTIKPEFFDDEHLCELPFQHRLCYIGLWTQADKAGRLEDRPKRLKARIFPFDDVDMNEMLEALAREGFIVRYQADGRDYLAIKDSSWRKHQRPRQDEPESVIPPHTYEDGSDLSLDSDGPVPAERLGKEGKGREEGTEGTDSSEAASGSEPTPDTAIAIFPVVGKGGSEWVLAESQLASWSELYPTIDVMSEVRKALAWIVANPGRRKTSRGMPQFLVGWLNRATDRSGGRRSSAGDQPFTQRELEAARNWMRSVRYCPHAPKCTGNTECQARFIRERLRLGLAS